MTTLRRLGPAAALLFMLPAAAALAGPVTHSRAAAAPPHATTPAGPPADATQIVAVVNGDVISSGDVTDRARLFALSTGLPLSPDALGRVKPQIIRQLVDERLRLQEEQRRHIIISDKQIADAIAEIEHRNNMPQGALRAKLAADGVGLRTLIDQLRVEIGWSQVLRQELAEQGEITDADVAAQQRLLAAQTGKTEYRVSEIYIPVEDPANAADAERFANTVIQQLHAGAAFAVVAAQFSQSQTALEGGDLGWVQANQLDPEVLRVVQEMPAGAVSNPLHVPGGFVIASLSGKREIGQDIGTVLSLRQLFLPFSAPLDPQAPTDQQRQTLERARALSTGIHSCEQMEAAAKANNSPRPADPGPLRLDGITPPAFRQMLATISFDRTTQPLISNDGVAIMIVCSRDQKNLAELSKQQIKDQLFGQRVELLSRQAMHDLHRRASIDMHAGGA